MGLIKEGRDKRGKKKNVNKKTNKIKWIQKQFTKYKK